MNIEGFSCLGTRLKDGIFLITLFKDYSAVADKVLRATKARPSLIKLRELDADGKLSAELNI